MNKLNIKKPKLKKHIKNTSYKALCCIFLVLAILCIGLISAWDWDNVKDYNADKREITITNALGLGDDIAKITLLTPTINYVIRGEDRKVAEFEINNFGDTYENAFKDLKFYNVKDNQEFQRDFTYKYEAVTGTKKVPVYKEVCEEVVEKNLTIWNNCYNIVDSYKDVDVTEWKEFSLVQLPKGIIKIGIFTDVKAGDNIEWIPTLFGVEIDEWATWTESFNVNLQGYYTLNESSGNALESVFGINDGVLVGGMTQGVGGIIGTAYDFDGVDGLLNFSDVYNYGGSNFSIAMWVNLDSPTTYQGLFSKHSIATDGWFADVVAGGTIRFAIQGGSTNDKTQISTTLSSGWNFIVFTIEEPDVDIKIYINGTEAPYSLHLSDWANLNSNDYDFIIGRGYSTGPELIGVGDEIGVWSRVLTPTEIENLWNGGAGLTYVFFDKKPNVIIAVPVNGTTYSSPQTELNYTATDDVSLSACWYSNNSGVINSTPQTCNTNWSSLTHSLGSTTWTVYANDSANQVNSTSVTFDFSIPLIVNITTPTNYTNSSDNTLDVNYTYIGTYIESCWWTENRGTTNTTITCGDNLTSETWNEGENTIIIYTNDSYAQTNSTSIFFTIDTIYPQINITYPQNTSYNTLVTRINITYVDASPNVCWYSNDSGVTNSTPQSCDTNFTNLTYGQGSHTINTYMNDAMGNENYSTPVTFFVDSIAPEINITSPANYTNSSDSGLDIDYIYVETNPDSCWWSEDRGVTNTTISCGTNLTTETWGEGSHTIIIYVNDTLNNANSSSIFFTIDTTSPVVDIVTPTNTTYTTTYAENNTAIVYLNWTASDTNLDSCWYSTNNSVNMSVTCGENQTLGLDYGTYTITACANDSANLITCSSVTAIWNYVINEGTSTFNSTEYETALNQFKANITSNISILSLTAKLIYNGTPYNSDVDCDSSYNCNLTNNIDIPLVYSGSETNYSFYWAISATDGITDYVINTNTNYQNVTRIYLQDCNATYTTTAINYTAWLEQNLTKIDNWTYEGSYDFWLGSGSVTRNYSSSNASIIEHNICISPYNRTFFTTAQIRYSKSGYITRDFYFYDEPISNETQDVKLLLLSTSDSTSFIVKVIDSDQLAVANAYVYVYKYDVGTGLFNLVEVSLTDASGATISHFVEEVVDYKIIIYLNGVVVFVGEKQKIFCEEVPCTIILQLTGEANTEWSAFGDISDLTYTLTFDAATNIWDYTYIDASDSVEGGRLYVYNVTGDTRTTICNTTSALTATTLTCDVSGQEGQVYAVAYIDNNPEILLSIKSAIIAGLKEIFGTEGLFLSMFVLLVLGLAGLWNPAVGIILEIAGMIMLSMLGLASFGAVAIWGIIFIGAIILWELKT